MATKLHIASNGKPLVAHSICGSAAKWLRKNRNKEQKLKKEQNENTD